MPKLLAAGDLIEPFKKLSTQSGADICIVIHSCDNTTLIVGCGLARNKLVIDQIWNQRRPQRPAPHFTLIPSLIDDCYILTRGDGSA